MSKVTAAAWDGRKNALAWVVGTALLVTIVTFLAVAVSVLVIPGLLVAGVATYAVTRVGFFTVAVAGSVAALGAAGFMSRIAPQADILTQAGVFTLILAGLALLPLVNVPKVVAVAVVVYLVLATGSAVLVATSHAELAFRGWVGLVGPVLAAAAAAGATRPNKTDDGAGRRKFVFAAVIATALANIVVGARQAIFGMNSNETISAMTNDSTYLVGDQIRLMGTFQSNQDFGAFGACIAPALLIMALRTKGQARVWLALTSFLFYIVILLSLTRTALIASIAVGLLGVFIWGRGSIPKRVFRGSFQIAAATAFLLFIMSMLDIQRVQDAMLRATSLFDLGGDTSYNARMTSTLPYAWGIFVDSPFGLGVGSAGPVSSAFSEIAPAGSVTADNGYLTIAIQLGFLGGAAFVAFLVGIVIYLGKSKNVYSIAGAAACLGLMVAMLTAGYWSLLAPVCVMTALIGLGISDHEHATPKFRTMVEGI